MKQYKRIFNLWALGLCLTLLNCGGSSSPPETPKGFTAVALNKQVMLTWDAQKGVTYDLFHSISAGLDVGSDATVPDATSPHTFTGLTNGTTYYYLLTATNSAGASEPTEEISATPLPPAAAPENFMAEASKEQVTLTWTAEEELTYDLYYSTAAGFSLEDGTKMPNVSSPHLHTGLTNDITYYYLLTAVNSAGASQPVEVSATPYIVRGISAGSNHTCAVVNDDAKCWGEGGSGRLGNSGNSSADLPQQATGLTSRVTQISAGDTHTCALVNGGFWCWGFGSNGELGNRANLTANTPQQARGRTSRATHISVGENYACAVMNGGAFCWGKGANGRLGHNEAPEEVGGEMVGGPRVSKSQPTQVAGGLASGVTHISAGGAHACAVMNGGAFCWGEGGNGRLGNGANLDANAPVQVVDNMGTAISGVTQISAGGAHTCAVVEGGALCWGENGSGQLGNGSTSDANAPQQVNGLASGVTHISAGAHHTCAVMNGSAFCWGGDRSGQLGDGGGSNANANTPQQVDGLTSRVTEISAGGSHTCAVVDDAALCWGRGEGGQVGDGMETQRNTPVKVRDFSN